MKNERKFSVAIIDSGIGGISILKQLIAKFNSGNYIYFADNQYMPYGNKDKTFVKTRVEKIINYLKNEYKVEKIIIACNTASSSIYPNFDNSVELLTFNKHDIYLTTQLTKNNLKGYNTISADDLASNIEKFIFKPKKMDKIIQEVVSKNNLQNFNSFVLGCTHYELVKDYFQKNCPNTKISLNSTKIINKIENIKNKEFNIKIILSKYTKNYKNKIIKLLK